MKILDADHVNSSLSYPELIDDLQQAFAGDYEMPPRNVMLLDEQSGGPECFAMLPSWNDSYISLKAFTYFPKNQFPDKTVYANILLFKRQNGAPLAVVDGTSVTKWRTAGISALASRLLSRENSETLLLLGTGNLATYLIQAHASVRNLKKVFVWGRNAAKAENVISQVKDLLPKIEFEVSGDIEAGCARADIIVAATGSYEPLVKGAWVREGTHTDFLGNHFADKRECDSELVLKSKIYLDSNDNCFKEAGEILLPISEGVLSKEDVTGELRDLCNGSVPGRQSDSEITLFKSVGTALADLVGASSALAAAD